MSTPEELAKKLCPYCGPVVPGDDCDPTPCHVCVKVAATIKAERRQFDELLAKFWAMMAELKNGPVKKKLGLIISTPGAKVAIKWTRFDKTKGSQQLRPEVGKAVLCICAPKATNLPEIICIGYRKDAAGDKQSPYFVTPGVGGEVLAWSDCLPDPDVHTLWRTAREIIL